jgi:hypothetical protein
MRKCLLHNALPTTIETTLYLYILAFVFAAGVLCIGTLLQWTHKTQCVTVTVFTDALYSQ